MNDATPACGWNEAAPSFPGKDCQCEAYGESECCRDADWTPSEVYKLRKEREELREKVARLQEIISQCLDCSGILSKAKEGAK